MTQTRLRYYLPDATNTSVGITADTTHYTADTTEITADASDVSSGHPHAVMRFLAKTKNFTILSSVPQLAGENWFYWIEYQGTLAPLPAFIQITPWLPIGEF